MKLETERLYLAALTPEQLEQLVYDTSQLEKELKCFWQAENIEGVFRSILLGQVAKASEDREHYLWHTFWLIIRKTDNVVVGTIDFKDIPDENGAVELGYGLGKNHEHNGYMTEAVGAMCNWAEKQEGVACVIAETEIDNKASQRILQKCGFMEYQRNETIWWKKSLTC